MNIFTFLLSLVGDAKGISTFIKVAKNLKGTPRALLKALVDNPDKVSTILGNMDAEGRKKVAEEINERTKEQGTETSSLSSSWLTMGTYNPTTAFTGDLTLYMKGNSTGYVYPGVPEPVWQAMKAAKGSNGSGAGSVFWAMYLRGYKKSISGQMTSMGAKLAGIKEFQSLAKDKVETISKVFKVGSMNPMKKVKKLK